MSVSVNGPKTPLTKGSNGIATATLPNICKMPGPPAPFVPAPLPNIGKSGDSPKGYSKKVKIEGNTVAIKGASFKSMGDMASKGTGGGLISANTHGPCKFISPGSMDVKFEGKNVHLLTDMVTNNGGPSGSPPNAATLQGAIQEDGVVAVLREGKCPICDEKHEDQEDFGETPETESDANYLIGRLRITKHWQTTMIGVVHCKNGHMYASSSSHIPKFIKFAQEDFHVYEGIKQLGTMRKMARLIGNSTSFRLVAQHADFAFKLMKALRKKKYPFPEESEEAKLARNAPGACAAQKALVLALEHNCTPSAITEKWYSPGRKPTAKVSEKPPVKTSVVRHINIEGSLDTDTDFGHGDSVPPCETCNLLLPFLICTKPKEGPCETETKGCAKCKGKKGKK